MTSEKDETVSGVSPIPKLLTLNAATRGSESSTLNKTGDSIQFIPSDPYKIVYLTQPSSQVQAGYNLPPSLLFK